jgi:hypothetical protein
MQSDRNARTQPGKDAFSRIRAAGEKSGFFNNLLGGNIPDAIVGRLRLMSQLDDIAVFDH